MKTSATLFIFLATLFTQLEAYCVYNNLPEGTGKFYLRQLAYNTGATYFNRFQRPNFMPGDTACCPYTDFTCNKYGKKDEELKMVIQRSYSDGIKNGSIITTFPAGGTISLGGSTSDFDFKLEVLNADGSKYPYQLSSNEQLDYS